MKLADVAGSGKSVHVNDLGDDKALCKEIQARLTALGCLDPKPDGIFGAVSKLTLALFASQMKLTYDDKVTGPIATALLEQKSGTFLPMQPGNDLAGRIATYMGRNGQFFARLPGFLTIVYLEGADPDGRPNADAADRWNDLRLVLRRNAKGKPEVAFSALATTEPGRFYTAVKPLSSRGAARIAFGQFKAWRVGTHHPHLLPPRRHEALTQALPITVFRDKNKDGIRPGDATQTGVFGINQHSGLDQSLKSIGKASAGCLVGRVDADHKAFMKLVKTDPRFRQASKGYTFMTSVIAGDDLAKQVPLP